MEIEINKVKRKIARKDMRPEYSDEGWFRRHALSFLRENYKRSNASQLGDKRFRLTILILNWTVYKTAKLRLPPGTIPPIKRSLPYQAEFINCVAFYKNKR